MKWNKSIAVLIFTAFFVYLHGQSLPLSLVQFKKYGPKEGILDKQINYIYQSKDGMIWFGGKVLQSFDGHRFSKYELPLENENITCLFENNTGEINVIVNFNKIFKFEKSTRKFINISKLISDKGFSITQAERDFKNRNWFNLSNAIGVLEHNNQLNIIESPFGNDFNIIGKLFLEDKKYLWFLDKNIGIVRYDIENARWTSMKNNINNEPIFNYPIQNLIAIVKDKKGNFWFIENKTQLLKYNPLSKVKKYYSIPYTTNIKNEKNDTYIVNVILDQKGEIWVMPGENLGIAKYSQKGDKLEILYSDRSKSYGIMDDAVLGGFANLYEDNQGNFWYTGLNIYSFNPYTQKTFTVETKQLLNESNNDSRKIQGTTPNGFVEMNNGRFYVGYYGSGILSMGKNFDNPIEVKFPKWVNKLIWTVFSNDGENLYFSDQNKGLYIYNIRSKLITKAFEKKNFSRYTNAYYVESDSIIWLAHHKDGITKINTDKNTFKYYKNISFPIKQDDENVYDIIPENKDYLWLATMNSGLVFFDKKNGKSVESFNRIRDRKIKTIYDIEPWNKDSIFLATENGVLLFNKKKKTFEAIGKNNELRSMLCSSVSLTNDNLLINTFYNGIFSYNIKTDQCYNIGNDEDNNYGRGDMAKYTFKNNDVAFSHNNGFTIIKSNANVKRNYNQDSIHITNLTVNEKSYASNSRLNLSHNENNVDIAVSTLNIAEIENTKYYVKANGIFNEWTLLKDKPEIELNKLSPGAYEFQFKAININTNAETKIKSLFINIDTPLYKKWWFISILLSLGILGIVLLERKKRKDEVAIEKLKSDSLNKKLEIEKQQRQLEDINNRLTELKLSNLRSRMNPHFIFNTLNSINSYVIKNDIHSASDYITKFSKLIRHILDYSKEETITLKEEVDILQLYLHIESLRFNQTLNFTIDIEENLDISKILIPPMLIQPFAENAIWHGLMPSKHDKNLDLRIYKTCDNFICIEIEDNGVGREKARESKLDNDVHHSQGIEITEQRMKYLNSKNKLEITDKKDADKKPSGTVISIYLYQ